MAEPPPAESQSESVSSEAAPSIQKPPEVTVEDDSDPDFDDLDDVLDQFSTAATSQSKSQPQPPAPSSSGPGRPSSASNSTASALPSNIPIPTGPSPNESEPEFLTRLTAEMSSVMSKMSVDPAANTASPEDIAKMGRQLEEFTHKMEAEGIQPEDLLKAILGEDAGAKVGEMAHEERERRESESQTVSKSKSGSPEVSRTEERSSSKPKPTASSFEDTIRKTMARMESSSAAASSATAAQNQKSEEDLLAEMLRALDSESGGAGGDDGDLSKMFLGMMEQLTNKDMLYEPMKELSQKYPEWLASNAPPKLSQSEFDRFTRQRVVVDAIVNKFEEKGYSDDDARCREYVWEKMQEMQGEGAPPEDLIANPFPGMGLPGLGLGGGGAEGMDEGCPTQ